MSDSVNVKVSADSSPFAAGLARVENSLESFKHHATEQFNDVGKDLLGAFAFTAVIEGVKGLIEEFSKIQDISDRLGTTAESVQKLNVVAKSSGVEIETLGKALAKTKAHADDALRGNDELADSFAAMNVDVKEFVNASPEQELLMLAEGYEKSADKANFLVAAQKTVGKSAIELQGIFAKGPEALREEMDAAKVASNDTVATMKEVSERFEKLWGNFKAYGAEAIDFIIKRVQALGTGFAAITAYVSNLTHGLDAAADAYDQVIQAAADLQIEEEQKRKDEEKRRSKPIDSDAIEGINKRAEEEKKVAAEIAKLKEQNAKKEEEAHFRNLSLLERQKELQEKISDLKNQKTASPLDAEKVKGQILDYQRELETVNKDIQREQEKDDKERAQKAKKELEEQTRKEIKDKKEELKGMEAYLKELTPRKDFSVDSLRQVGGGIAGANYKADTAALDMQRQQVDYAKQQIDKLQQIIDQLQTQAQTIQTYDGSFSD